MLYVEAHISLLQVNQSTMLFRMQNFRSMLLTHVETSASVNAWFFLMN